MAAMLVRATRAEKLTKLTHIDAGLRDSFAT